MHSPPTRGLFDRLASFCAFVAIFPLAAAAGQTGNARVSAIVQDVQLIMPDGTAGRPSLGGVIMPRSTLRTGADSRVELTFDDKSIARLGTNTAVNLDGHQRHLLLHEGIILLQIPRGAKQIDVQAERIGVSISDATATFESHPQIFKFVVLEGVGRLFRRDRLADSVLVKAGQMVFGSPNRAVTDPVDLDIAHFVNTSRLILDFHPLFGNAAIAKAGQAQEREKSKRVLTETNLVIHGGGSLVSVEDSGKTDKTVPAVATPPASVSAARPSPSEN
jgi:FecR protein